MNITDLPERMQSKIRTDCWIWTASVNSKGYGCYSIDGKSHLAHRVAYESAVGPIPEGAQLDHLCRNVRCVNPEHLEPVTQVENMARVSEAYTVCKAGHEMTAENTIVKHRAKGRVSRECRACNIANQRAARERRKGAPLRAKRGRIDLDQFKEAS
jgi:hypothetical protein